ncbi:apolipoprotein N-acyltransferase [Faucicola boevrei]|uniref:apolipoprotein N-acyltransferase n=1 Tax=Faucicola boevrei TaxID=346665 RepID=UPI00035CBD45|nr:apolipoprotein N-acyltransferase [Moraxella boevrei]
MRLTTQSLKKQLQFQQVNPNKSGAINQFALLPRLAMAWLAGAVFLFSLAPYYIWGIALISPAILYALLIAPMSHARAFWIGEIYGMGLWCVGAFWLYTSIHTYGNTPMPIAIGMIAIMGLIMGLFHGLLAVGFNHFFAKQPFSFTALWVVQEWLKTWLFTGFPWLFVGYAFTEQVWLNSLAPLFGVLAMSFVAVFLSSSVVEIAKKQYHFSVLASVMLVASSVLWLLNPAWTTPKNTPNLSVSLIQGNIPQDLKWLLEFQEKTLEIYAELSQSEWGQDIVVWPESSIPMLQTEAWPFISQVAEVAKRHNTTWITGIPYADIAEYDPKVDDYEPFYNSVMALGAEAKGLYKKQNLVPVGEYTPFEGLLNWALPELMSGSVSFRSGKPYQDPLLVKNNQVGVAICYEVAYPDTTRRNARNTDFLLTVSNDAWFGTSAGPLQHLQMVQMRSLETGRWFVRATNTGVTAIINHKGEIVRQAPQFERTVLRGEVQARQGTTPFMQWGSYPILMLSGVLLLISWLSNLAKRSKNQR